ncbi:MAG TPA: Na+/H+ antiporter NhaA [Solirubrobacteraceae bacterium]|jgi:Na+/H+ antiporter NhaA|nr:Na+/H+ antiporter NhaA [Solirubrobacteraceae bacterium]
MQMGGESGAADALAPPSSAFTDRTAWARNLATPIRDFLTTETGGAAVLLGAVLVAWLWANSPWSSSYESLWSTKLSIQLGASGLSQDLRHWINDGLMTFFFLVAGLEARREIDMGQLRERRRIALPAISAFGGAALAVLIYLAFNAGSSGAHGWGAVMSTDTAFALGVLALVAPGGTRLRVYLLTLAIADDLVALVVIATAYTAHVSLLALALAIGFFAALLALRYLPRIWRRRLRPALGVAIWVALYESGIDPVIAGLALGLTTSAYPPVRGELEQVSELTRSFREQPTPGLARTAQLGLSSAISPNERLQHLFHPWTSYLIVPLFALANAGVHVSGKLLSDAFTSPVTLGIVCGYVLGKPLGILGASWLASRRWLGGLPRVLSWPGIVGDGAVAGVGFTVALLISSLAFRGLQLEEATLGVLTAGVLASFTGWIAFRVIARLPTSVRARQLIHTEEEILDLADDIDPARDHVRGAKEAPVTLLEYGDYECPYCGQAEVVIRELLDSFGDELRYVWRHLPLNDVHPHAQMAAEAAEAAASQGDFWAMHDTLLAHQNELSLPALRDDAERLGLDVERFWEDLRRRAHAPRIDQDVATADASDVAGTPTFFINGRRHHGAYDVASLTAAVSASRARARLRRHAKAAPH